MVRRAVGYHRYDTEAELALLNDIYALQRLQINFFSPQQKLVSKTRHGATVTKRYDTAKTPHQRVLADHGVLEQIKTTLTAQYADLNPAQRARDPLVAVEPPGPPSRGDDPRGHGRHQRIVEALHPRQRATPASPATRARPGHPGLGPHRRPAGRRRRGNPDRAVTRARQAGHPWAAIGDRLGITRQAAHQRFSTPHSAGQPGIPR